MSGASGNYVQCFDCRNAPILHTRGDQAMDIKVRLESTAEYHEQRHRGHDVVVYLKSDVDLPVVRVVGSST